MKEYKEYIVEANKNGFKNQKEIWAWLVSGKKVAEIRPNGSEGTIYFFKGGKLESGVSMDVSEDFSDVKNWVKAVA